MLAMANDGRRLCVTGDEFPSPSWAKSAREEDGRTRSLTKVPLRGRVARSIVGGLSLTSDGRGVNGGVTPSTGESSEDT